jgi:hypothetical protein
MAQISVGGKAQQKASPERIIDNPPSSSVASAVSNAKQQVQQAQRK